MNARIKIGVAAVAAAATSLTGGPVAHATSSTIGCGVDCLGVIAQAVGSRGHGFLDGEISGVELTRGGPVITTAALHVTYSVSVTNGVLRGFGELRVTDAYSGISIDTPVSVRGTMLHMAFDSTTGGETHLGWQSTSAAPSAPGRGFFVSGAPAAYAGDHPLPKLPPIDRPPVPVTKGGPA